MRRPGGDIFIEGRKITAPSPQVGYMFQKDTLLEWRTVLDNVLIGAELLDLDMGIARRRAQELLRRYGLGEFMHSLPHQLSGGMRQRAALARTLCPKPDLLLLDEPFSALDYQTRLALSDEIAGILAAEQKTVILVTHDIGEAISMADRVVVMSRRPGRIKSEHRISYRATDQRGPVRSRRANAPSSRATSRPSGTSSTSIRRNSGTGHEHRVGQQPFSCPGRASVSGARSGTRGAACSTKCSEPPVSPWVPGLAPLAPARSLHSPGTRPQRRAARPTNATCGRCAVAPGRSRPGSSGVVVFLILWEVAPRANWINPMLTSYPSAVTRTFMAMLEDGSLAKHTWVTFSETVVGFAGGMLLGTVCAVLLWWSTFLYRVLDPFIVALNAMPKIALVPIFYIWLGDVASIYAMAIAVSVFITILMLYTGFQAIDPDKIKLVRLFGASRWKVLTKIVLPGSVPTMISTLKVNVGLALVGVVVGEFQAAKAGLEF